MSVENKGRYSEAYMIGPRRWTAILTLRVLFFFKLTFYFGSAFLVRAVKDRLFHIGYEHLLTITSTSV